MRTYFLLCACLFLLASGAESQVISFPGAEGFGKFATGGRGGKVIVVSNLNDDGPGSLRDAIQKKYPRIIVFSVSGNIDLQSPLDINHGDVTIAGQTAPGEGICIRNFTTNIKSDNVIVRFLRFRMGNLKKYEGDALSGTRGKKNIIIDHCSISWATDECASFYNNEMFTMQWCIISESLNHSVHTKGDHGYGGIWGGRKASFHHNLIANHSSRLPRFSGSASTPNTPDELVDFRNNVIYNWMINNTYGGEKGKYNIVGNYYKAGPATKSSRRRNQILEPWPPTGKFYVHGNVLEGNAEVTRENRIGIGKANPDSVLLEEELEVVAIPVEDASASYARVLALAGASVMRDAVDKRIVAEVKSGKSTAGAGKNGIIDSQEDVGGWPDLQSAPPQKDSDQDGMPDAWEKEYNLNYKDPGDAIQQTLLEGYDNIEVYANEIAEKVVSRHPQ